LSPRHRRRCIRYPPPPSGRWVERGAAGEGRCGRRDAVGLRRARRPVGTATSRPVQRPSVPSRGVNGPSGTAFQVDSAAGVSDGPALIRGSAHALVRSSVANTTTEPSRNPTDPIRVPFARALRSDGRAGASVPVAPGH
jgi:hypothetical protein